MLFCSWVCQSRYSAPQEHSWKYPAYVRLCSRFVLGRILMLHSWQVRVEGNTLRNKWATTTRYGYRRSKSLRLPDGPLSGADLSSVDFRLSKFLAELVDAQGLGSAASVLESTIPAKSSRALELCPGLGLSNRPSQSRLTSLCK